MLCLPDTGSRISTSLMHLCSNSNSSSRLAPQGETPGRDSTEILSGGGEGQKVTQWDPDGWLELPPNLTSSLQEPPRRGDSRPSSTREGGCFTALPLAELQSLCSGRASASCWASKEVDTSDRVAGYGLRMSLMHPGRARTHGDRGRTCASICLSPLFP